MTRLSITSLGIPLLAALLAVTAAALLRRPAPAFPLPQPEAAPIIDRFTAGVRRLTAQTQPTHHACLDARISPPLVREMTIDQLAEFVRSAAGVDVRVDWLTLDSAGIDRESRWQIPHHSSTVLDFLNATLAMNPQSFGFEADDKSIVITTAESLRSRSILCIYDIRDIVTAMIHWRSLFGSAPSHGASAPGAGMFVSQRRTPESSEEVAVAELRSLILEVVDRESWIENGGKCSLHYLSGRLLVVQIDENQRQLSALLDLLRRSLTAPDAQMLRMDSLETRILRPSNPDPVVIRIYNIRDLVADELAFSKALVKGAHRPTPASSGAGLSVLTPAERFLADLMAMIRDSVDPLSWIDNGGKEGSIHSLSGQLIIAQTPANHAQIAALLKDFRASLHSPATQPAAR